MRTMQVYYDYDGVFGDTMNPAIKEMKELGLYDTEEGRTKYFRELKWREFLKKTPFIKNSPETVNALMKLNYKVSFLTHVNSLDEHVDKIIHVKSTEELDDTSKIDVIAVPRIIDKSITIDPRGHILIDDRLENIIAWEEMGGIGVLFSDKPNPSYITIDDPLDLINVVMTMDKSEFLMYLSGDNEKDKVLLRKAREKSSKVPVNNDGALLYISDKINKYKHSVDAALKYHLSIMNNHLVDRNYNIKRMEYNFKVINFYNDVVNRKILYTYKLSYSNYHDLLEALLLIDFDLSSKDKKSKTLSLNNKKKNKLL